MFNYIKCLIYILLLLNFIYIPNVNAATINSKSCSRSDVQAAINSASNGDTVVVPSGESTWTSYVVVTVDGLDIQGAGVGSTIIHRFGFQFNHGIDNWRLHGFTFDGDGVSPNSNWSGSNQLAVRIGNGTGSKTGCKNFRIDHNYFDAYRAGSSSLTGCYTILAIGFCYGVIDNNTFHDCRGEVIVYTGDGTPAFSRSGMGGYTNGTIFIETNTFELSSNNYGAAIDAYDCSEGSRVTFRYNNMTDNGSNDWAAPTDNHGKCYNAVGAYSNEIYENTYTKSNNNWGYFAQWRGGMGVFYNNTVTGGSLTHGLFIDNTRSWKDCTYGGLCSSHEGYPCDYQVGDYGDLYIWGNTHNGSPMEVYVRDSGETRNYIQQNRDYFTKKLVGYTPYTYPHPLTRGSSTSSPEQPPAPPTGITIQKSN